MSQFAFNQIVQIVKALLDSKGVGQQQPRVYETFLAQISNPNTEMSQMMMQIISTQTGGRWVNGMNFHDLANMQQLRNFINDGLTHIHKLYSQVAVPQQQGYAQPAFQQQPGYGFQPPVQPGFSATAGLYQDTPQQAAPPVQPAPATYQPVDVKVGDFKKEYSMETFDLGRPVLLKLNPADTLQHHPKPGNVVSVSDYSEGEFEGGRLSTITIKLHTAENDAKTAAEKALFYSPNEVLRGKYANVIEYKSLVHVPIAISEFKRITALIGAQFYGEVARRTPEWRNAVAAMGTLTRGEHKIIEEVLLHFLNPAMVKFLRTTKGEVIESIDEIDDLRVLDDSKCKLKVTKHANYVSRFNEIVTRAFDILINPDHLIEPEDKNFGDFVHCDKIEFWHDDRSKYDYGTYPEKLDRQRFISSMTDHHTVLRVPRYVVVTNAFEYNHARNISNYRTRDNVILADVQNVGCKLLLELHQPKSSEIDGVLCVGDGPYEPNLMLRLGRTLDGSQVLIS